MSSSDEQKCRNEHSYELGSCLSLDVKPKGSWSVFAIDFNKQEYGLGGIVQDVNHGQELHLPILMVDKNSHSLGFKFPAKYGEIEVDGILQARTSVIG